MKTLLKIILIPIFLILFFYALTLTYYKINPPIKLTDRVWLDKSVLLENPNNDWYFYYGIYNPSMFDLKIMDMKVNSKNVKIEKLGLRDVTNNPEETFKEIDETKPFILKRKSRAQILLVFRIYGLNSELENIVFDYTLLGIPFRQRIKIELFNSEMQNTNGNFQPVIDEIKKNEEVTLIAKDVSEEKLLSQNDRKRLIEALEKSNIINDDDFFTGQAISPAFPLYMLRFGNKEILFIDKTKILVRDPKYFSFYLVPKDIWNEMERILPVNKLNDVNDLVFLFKAEKLKIEDTENEVINGDYTYIKEKIIRTLRTAEAVGELQNKEGEKLILKFQINGKEYAIYVYNDGFIYNNNFYEKKGIKEDIELALQAV